ncbi:MAG: hypothetical protein RMX96_30980 [Nostoc sp. ChiSLP02]|nr:hypothetical protein [Nostoc sp. DedSLP05]MDZ8103609.1 hypothetical protein [Nostoc sp. DedSLP01]MDZ8189250.1 hypothetical protein [Nostoc sp. ChiSLP02]
MTKATQRLQYHNNEQRPATRIRARKTQRVAKRRLVEMIVQQAIATPLLMSNVLLVVLIYTV